jgi:hypothetical protein
MSGRAAELASAILIGVLVGVFAGAYLIIMPYGTADDCLAEPKGDAPQGQHWYYRIDRGTKRHCWYLKGQGERVARAASPERAAPARTASSKTESSKTESSKTEMTAQRSVADAHAELPSRARIEDDTSAFATKPAPAPIIANAAAPAANTAAADDNGAGSNVMSRWPEPTGVNSTADTPPEQPPVVVADNTQPDRTAAAPMTAAPMTAAPMSAAPADAPAAVPETASTAVGKYSGSLQELLVVAFAALALAGLTGSAVYRLASLRHAKRRYDASRRSADWQAPKKKRKARPAKMTPEHFAPSAELATPANFAPQTNFAPRREFAPRANFAPKNFAPKNFAPENFAPEPVAEYAPRANFVPQDPVSEYAPKPRFSHAGAQTQSNDNFEAIEELLMRLAK